MSVSKAHQIGFLGVLLRHKDIPQWVTEAYVLKFESGAASTDAEFVQKRDAVLRILGIDASRYPSRHPEIGVGDWEALEAEWNGLLSQPPTEETLVSLNALLLRVGAIPPYFRRRSWLYLCSDEVKEAEGICQILATSKRDSSPKSVTTRGTNEDYYKRYRTENEDKLIPIDVIVEQEGKVWSTRYVRENRLLMADIERTFRDVWLYDPDSPMFSELCDVLVSAISANNCTYIQGLTYLCGVTLLFTTTLHEAVGIGLRIMRSHIYRSFMLMNSEMIALVGSCIFKLARQIFSPATALGSPTKPDRKSKLMAFFKPRDKRYAGLRYHGYVDPDELQRRAKISPDLDLPVSQFDARMHSLCCTLFDICFDSLHHVFPAAISGVVLTLGSKTSFELSLFILDALSYARDLEEAFCVVITTIYVYSIASLCARYGLPDLSGFELAEDELIEKTVSGITRLEIPSLTRFTRCYGDVCALYRGSEDAQQQVCVIRTVFASVYDGPEQPPRCGR